MNADDRITYGNTPAHNSSKRNPSKVIAIVEIRDEHLKKRLAGNFWRRHILHDRLKKRRHIRVVFVQVAKGKSVFRACVNDWKIELLVGCFELDEEIENHIDDFMRSCIFSVDLVNDNDRLQSVFQRLA